MVTEYHMETYCHTAMYLASHFLKNIFKVRQITLTNMGNTKTRNIELRNIAGKWNKKLSLIITLHYRRPYCNAVQVDIMSYNGTMHT